MSRVRTFFIFSVCVGLLWSGSFGCIKRTKVVTKPREDQALAGNRGYLLGTPAPSQRQTPPTRTYYETEVEIPTIEMHIQLPQWRREWVDKDLSGNRGYLVGGPYQSKTQTVPAPKRSSFFQPRPEPVVPEEAYEEEGEETYDTYTVQKGETLGEISGKVYGTSRKWKQIFEANQDVLSDPNKVKAGQVLRIPRGEEPARVSQDGTIK